MSSLESETIPPAAPKLLLRGLDSLYVSLYLDTASSGFDWDALHFAKERLRTRREEVGELELGSERLALLPYGKKPYAYILANRDFEIRLATRMQPSCHVQFSSEGLWRHGLDALWERVRRWHAAMGFVPIRPEIVARADWAFDYQLAAPDFALNWFVSRSAKDAQHRENGQMQTFTFGRGDTVIRVYDKAAEIEQQSGKAWFHQLWGVSEGVWRIEFQVRGERLREAGIRTLDDLRTCQGDLLRELSHGHTTLRQPLATDTNRSRWPLHPLWSQLQSDIATLPQTGLVRAIDDPAVLRWRLRRQIESVYGHFKGIGATLSLLDQREDPMDLEALLAELPQLLADEPTPLWRADVARRMADYRLGRW